ncbi:MAG: tRNA (adenosine(37)-N6)-threonylcarbamoyltransferase complex transferase subunit TsaD [Burkholderiales bacterium]
MLVLGIESSCDETGVALYDSKSGLLGHTLHSQIELHDAYGGVVPELASRDHIRRLLPLIEEVLNRSNRKLSNLDAIAYTRGPGLAGALLVGASVSRSLAFGLGIQAIGIHHLEGHLLSPLLDASPPNFPFIALLVSGGHTQIMQVSDVGQYELLGDTMDDAAGEAFDKTAKLLGLPYPGGPALAKLAQNGSAKRFPLPRPMISSNNLDFSFSGLKTAVAMACANIALDDVARADMAASFQEAVVDVLVAKCVSAMEGSALDALVVAGGVGANLALRQALDLVGSKQGFKVYYPAIEYCTDNGAMIALAGALRLVSGKESIPDLGFDIHPRWDLCALG